MKCHQSLSLLFVSFLLLVSQAMAATPFESAAVAPLAGRNVMLMVGSPETTATWKSQYLNLLSRSGADMSRYPVYQAASLPADVAQRLGLGGRATGYAVLVRWGNPARFGPARVLQPVVTALSSDADLYVLVESALLGASQGSLLNSLPENLQVLRPRAELVIEQVDFQANGSPLFLVNANVRIRNNGKKPASGMTVVFSIEDPKDQSWFELGRQSGLLVKAGSFVTRDLVRTTHDTPLLNDKNEVQPVKYRIQVEFAQEVLESTGEFQPQLLQDQAVTP